MRRFGLSCMSMSISLGLQVLHINGAPAKPLVCRFPDTAPPPAADPFQMQPGEAEEGEPPKEAQEAKKEEQTDQLSTAVVARAEWKP